MTNPLGKPEPTRNQGQASREQGPKAFEAHDGSDVPSQPFAPLRCKFPVKVVLCADTFVSGVLLFVLFCFFPGTEDTEDKWATLARRVEPREMRHGSEFQVQRRLKLMTIPRDPGRGRGSPPYRDGR